VWQPVSKTVKTAGLRSGFNGICSRQQSASY